MLKKFLSVLLAVMMVVSVMAVSVVTTGAADAEPTLNSEYLYFDASTTDWLEGGYKKTTDTIAFHIFGGDVAKTNGWGAKKTRGELVEGTDGIIGIQASKVMALTDDVQYKIIFIQILGGSSSAQTYDLLFDTTCLGDVAYCNGTMYENPVDSSKKTLAAFWRSKDSSEYGPVLQITSIGNVVGTCPEEGKTPESIFTDFISVINTDYNDTALNNARKFVVDVGTKTEQQMIDDIGAGLHLSKEQVAAAFTDNAVATTWSADDSTLPSGSSVHEHTPGEAVRENEVPASCTAEGSYDEVVYCTECGEEISRETKTIDKLDHTAGEAVRENEVPASCTAAGSYDEVVYCTECQAEISRETKTIDAKGHDLTLVPEVPATEEAAGTSAYYFCSRCEKKFSDATGNTEVSDADLVIPALPHTHVPGEPVQDTMAGNPATCEEGGVKVMVTYCTKCGEEISRENIDLLPLGHDLTFVEKVEATNTENGMEAHYECSRCPKLFSDAEAKNEVTAESLIIKAAHARGDANSDGDVDVLDATAIQRFLIKLPNEKFDEISADADRDGEVDIIDATLIQRIDIGMITFADWDAKHAK